MATAHIRLSCFLVCKRHQALEDVCCLISHPHLSLALPSLKHVFFTVFLNRVFNLRVMVGLSTLFFTQHCRCNPTAHQFPLMANSSVTHRQAQTSASLPALFPFLCFCSLGLCTPSQLADLAWFCRSRCNCGSLNSSQLVSMLNPCHYFAALISVLPIFIPATNILHLQ